jgi:hypothetical protein
VCYSCGMSVEELTKAVADLPPDKLAKFRAWFETFDADHWDRQIEADIKTGKLDKLADDALAEHAKGLTREL